MPHTASEAANDGGHAQLLVPAIEPPACTPPRAELKDRQQERLRVLAVKLDLRNDNESYQRLKELSWQAARYRNLFLRGRWCEAVGLCVDPKKGVENSVTKRIRRDEKMDLSGAAYSAAEREAQAEWQKHCKRILAGAPLPEWKPTKALTIRGHKKRQESGVRLSKDEQGRYIADLQVQGDDCQAALAVGKGGSWLHIPLALGAAKDWQAEKLDQMVTGEISIRKAAIQILPEKHQVILKLSYPQPILFPRFGERKATLGPIIKGERLWLRTEFESRDFSGRLHTLLERKTNWDATRRRVMAQIGRRRGGARLKRKKLAEMTWQGWLDNYLHQWTREIITWLDGQGIASLTVMGLNSADWPVYRFTQMLTYKGESLGVTVTTEADLATPATERAVKGEIRRQRRKATKAAVALRELTSQIEGS
jgi:hypothetical protein